MTRSNILVSMAANHMTFDVMQPAKARSLRDYWRQWLGYLYGLGAPDSHVVQSVVVRGSTAQQGLASVFQQGLEALRHGQSDAQQDRSMEVVLGPSLSHVGVVDMVSDGSVKLSDADRRAYVDVWISQNWGLQSSECEIRYIPVGQSTQFLVSCIARSVIETINTLCEQEQITLRSCKPALANHLVELISRLASPPAINGTAPSPVLDVTAFVESGLDQDRMGAVQFVVSDASGILSINRLWLPHSQLVTDELAIAQVAARLCAQHGSTHAPHITTVRWPRSQAAGAPV